MIVQEYYESQAEHNETGSEIDGRVRKAAGLFKKHLGRADKLLDIGCGVGAVGLYLGRALGAKEIYGVEISEKRAEAARARGIKIILHDLNKGPLPLDGAQFDAIFCGEIIEHLLDPDHLLDEVARNLAPHGVCVITTPNLASWTNRLALLFGWQPFYTSVSYRHEVGRPRFLVSDYGCRDHLRVFTLTALRQLLGRHEFRVLETKGTTIGEVDTGVRDFRLSPLRAALYHTVWPLDTVASLFPSLATRVVVAFGNKTK